MLIRNVSSKKDLESKKKIQAALLQIQIDNEAEIEKRLKNYQNPNAPPPVPPQYKTNAEIQADALTQQKIAITNLESLGLDLPTASQVTQDLIQLPDGITNLQKLNLNFPFIQDDIKKRLNLRHTDSNAVMFYLREYFIELDNVQGLNLNSTTTSLFNTNPLSFIQRVPDSELMQQLLDVITPLPFDLTPTINILRDLVRELPTHENMDLVDTFPKILLNRLAKLADAIINQGLPDTASVLNFTRNAMTRLQLGIINNAIKNAPKSINLIREFNSIINKEVTNITRRVGPPLPRRVEPVAPAVPAPAVPAVPAVPVGPVGPRRIVPVPKASIKKNP
jgi:hypothetical protein